MKSAESPLIRLSEVIASYAPVDDQIDFVQKLQRLALDGQVEVHGQHVWIIDEFEAQVSSWQLISPESLAGGEWDWTHNQVRFDPNERPDFGVSPRHFRLVSLVRVELFDWLELQASPIDRPQTRPRGRPAVYDWGRIVSVATALAVTGFRSQNAFINELSGVLADQGLDAPGTTTLKTRDEIRLLARQAILKGRKMPD